MGYVGAGAKAWAIQLRWKRAYMVIDLLIDLQLRSCTEKYNIPPCYGEHWTNRDKRLFEPPHKPLYVDIDVPHISPT